MSDSRDKTSAEYTLPPDHVKEPFVVTNTVIETHYQPVFGVAFNPYVPEYENPIFATVGANRVTMYECDVHAQTHPISLKKQYRDLNKEEKFYAVSWCFDRDSLRHLVVAGGEKHTIRVICPSTNTIFRNMTGHGGVINEIRTNPGNAMVFASASKDQTVRVWHLRSEGCLAILGGYEGHRDQILSLEWSECCKYIVSASMDHTVKMWNVCSGEGGDEISYQIQLADEKADNHMPMERMTTPPVEMLFPRASTNDLHTNYVDCVRVIGDFVVSKSSENTVCVWKFGEFDDPFCGKENELKIETTVSQLATLENPDTDSWFIKLDVDPYHRWIACGTQQGRINLWPLDNGMPPAEPTHCVETGCSVMRQVAFSPNGEVLICVADDGSVTRLDRQFKGGLRHKPRSNGKKAKK